MHLRDWLWLVGTAVVSWGCGDDGSPFIDPGCDDWDLPVATFVYIGVFDADGDEPLCVEGTTVTVFQGSEGPVPMMRSDDLSGRLVRDDDGEARLEMIYDESGCNLYVVPTGPAPGRDTTWGFERCAEPIDYTVNVPGFAEAADSFDWDDNYRPGHTTWDYEIAVRVVRE
jgi:hypothetical protein